MYYGYNARITDSFTATRASDNKEVSLSVPRNATYYFKNGSIIQSANLPLDKTDYTYQVIQAQREWVPGNGQASVALVPGYTYYHKVIGGTYKSQNFPLSDA